MPLDPRDPRVCRIIAEENGVSISKVQQQKIARAPVGPPTLLDRKAFDEISRTPGRLKDVARKFGVSPATVWRVKHETYSKRMER